MISDPGGWRRARALFDEVVDLDDAAARARLALVARDDPALCETVARLLAADRSADTALRPFERAVVSGASRDAGGDGAASSARRGDAHDPLGVVGRTVSHFRVGAFVAAGGMGVVYRAEDLTLGRIVALKFPLPQERLGAAVHERFVNEARSAGALDHANLCPVHEIGESDHGVFLAMPLYAGETLKAALARRGAFPVDEALDVATQVTRGLAFAHAAGIVHRDLKPGNVMLLPDGTVKVLDFGLAKIRDVDLTKSRATLGTIGYVAPEQVRRGAADARVDLWSIGVLLHEMLAGAPPFRGEHEVAVLHAVLHDDPPPPSALVAGVTPAIDDVVATLLRKDPRDRHPSADALLADLEALRRGATPVRRRPAWHRAARRRMRGPTAAAAVGALAIVAAGAWVGLARTDDTAPNAVASNGATTAPRIAWRGGVAEIATGAQLAAALVPGHAGRRLRLRAGTYDVAGPLVVPDGMTIEGAGTMRVDTGGLPLGFAERGRTVLRMVAADGGAVLTLGNGATLRGIEVVDLAGRAGNVVAVVSRRPDDSVSATLIDVVLVNPNPLTISPTGAIGRALSVVTLNPNLGQAPAPHEGSALSLRVVRSIVRAAAGGGGVFAFNFAARGSIAVELERSVIGGSNEANGGVSRPDRVTDATVRIASRGNVYRNEWMDPCTSTLLGWNMTGGSGAPIPMRLPETTRNRLEFRSSGDRIEGFTTAVLATGSRRFFADPLNAAPRDNHVALLLVDTRIATPHCPGRSADAAAPGIVSTRARAIADVVVVGAWVESGATAAGDGNTVRAELRGVVGSGPRANQWMHVGSATGMLPAALHGRGNALTIVGDPGTFARSNRELLPPPAAGLFERGREPVGRAIANDGVNPPPRSPP